MNTPQWVFGHLAVCTDYGLKLLGRPTSCPKAWYAAFGIGSDPAKPPEPQPSKAELLEALASGHARLNAAMAEATPAQLSTANPFDFLAKRCPRWATCWRNSRRRTRRCTWANCRRGVG